MDANEASVEVAKLQADLAKTHVAHRYQLLATFLGTTVVSLVASYLLFVQNTEKNHQDFDGGHREFVSKFVDIAIDADIERRQRLARYFASVTLEDKQRERWTQYADYIDGLVKNNPAEIAELTTTLSSAQPEQRSALEARIQFLERQLRPTERANVQTSSSRDCISGNEDHAARWLCIARNELELGMRERDDQGLNPRLRDYFEFAAPEWTGAADPNVPWSGLFIAWVVVQSGIDRGALPQHPLQNRSWLKFGSPIQEPRPGAIAVFWRDKPDGMTGMAGFFEKETPEGISIISGNVRDAVGRTVIPKDRLLGYRAFP